MLGRCDWTSDTQEAGAHWPPNRELPMPPRTHGNTMWEHAEASKVGEATCNL